MFKRHGVEIYAGIALVALVGAYGVVWVSPAALFTLAGLLSVTVLFAGMAGQAAAVRSAR